MKCKKISNTLYFINFNTKINKDIKYIKSLQFVRRLLEFLERKKVRDIKVIKIVTKRREITT